MAAACGGDSRPAPTTPTTPTTPTPGPSGDEPTLRVAVLLSASRVPSADEVRRVFTRANEILFQKTGERMSQVDHYGTAQCTSRTGMSVADAQNLVLFQQSCGMCPDLCSQFRHR